MGSILRFSDRVGRRPAAKTLLLLFELELELEFALRLPWDDLPVCTHVSTSVIDHEGSILSYPIHVAGFVIVLNVPSLSGSCIVPLHNLRGLPVFDAVYAMYGKTFEKYFHSGVLRLDLGVYL